MRKVLLIFKKKIDFLLRNKSLSLLLLLLLILPFMDGGTSEKGQLLLWVFPLPLCLMMIAEGKLKIKIDLVFFWSFLFLITAAVSLIFTSSLALSIPAFLNLISLFLLFHLSRSLIGGKEELKAVMTVIFIVALGLSFLTLWYLLPFSTEPSSTMNLFYISYGHNHLAEYLPFALIPSLALFFKSRNNKKRKLIYGFLSTFFFVVLILTFSRTSFLFFPLILFLLIKNLGFNFKRRKTFLVILFLVPLFFLITITFFSEFGLNDDFLKQNYLFLKKVLSKPFSYEGRLDYWQQGWRGFLERPIFGWGWGTFRIVSLRFQDLPSTFSWYTHNFYLQILVEIGISGFASLIVFIFYSLSKVWDNIKSKDNHLLIGVFFALIFSCLQSILDFGWHFPAIFLVFLLLLGSFD